MSSLSFKNLLFFSSVLFGFGAVLTGPGYFLKVLKGFYEKPEVTLYPVPCVLGSCLGPSVSCILDSKCRKTLECIQACTLDERYDRIAGCAYICEMTHGYENKEFLDTIGCLIDNKCLDDYPNDGVCLGEDKDGMENIQTLEQIQGDWWVTWGLNCGEGDYPGGYDGYPCQHERFIQQDDGQWINNVTYCSGKYDKCNSDIIVTIANISLPHPGVIEHVYTDAPLSPQIESWRIISWPDQGDYMLSLWCGRLPVLDYAGGLVMSRHRNGKGMPQKTLKEFKRVAKRYGISWDMMCENNNDLCSV